jgi:hypothetical protein
MIRVQQSRFGHGNGDCLLACVASVLERPLKSIPDFSQSGCGWFEDLYEWCLNERIGLICLNPVDLNSSIVLNSWCIMIFTVDGCNCCNGKVPDENHAVVGRCKRLETSMPDAQEVAKWKWEAAIEFDPNPKGVIVGKLEHIIFLLPEQPLRAALAQPSEKEKS